MAPVANDDRAKVPSNLEGGGDGSHNGNREINDLQFSRDLKRLKDLRSFLIQEAVDVKPFDSGTISFGGLNLLRYGLPGRAPTEEEWKQVEDHTQRLYPLLTEPLRRRFLLGLIPGWVTSMPIVLAVIALGALIAATFVQRFHPDVNLGAHSVLARTFTLPCYLIWLVSLGAIGSIAFIGMNALSVQQDITFDLTNSKLMMLRIVLGALFGLVLSLPFGFSQFVEFIQAIVSGSDGSNKSGTAGFTLQAMLLLLPFILGFSTSLVIMILNKLVDAVQAFFGKTGTAEPVQTVPRSSPAPFPTATSTANNNLKL